LPGRAVEAVWRAAEELSATDLKRVAAALVEAASNELQSNERFARSVRVLFDALAPAKPNKSGSRTAKPTPVTLVPIKRIEGREIDLGAPPDPYFLHELYGDKQLPLALSAYPVKALQEAVEIVQERHPGTKPIGKSKAAIVEYLVKVTAAG